MLPPPTLPRSQARGGGRRGVTSATAARTRRNAKTQSFECFVCVDESVLECLCVCVSVKPTWRCASERAVIHCVFSIWSSEKSALASFSPFKKKKMKLTGDS